VIGQQELVGPTGFLRKSVAKKALFSMILFGPPGTGKTTIAEAYAKTMKVHFASLNAVTTSKQEMQQAVEEAKLFHPSIIIMDEVHRLDKQKQDFLIALRRKRYLLFDWGHDDESLYLAEPSDPIPLPSP
jgi:putative ATPase